MDCRIIPLFLVFVVEYASSRGPPLTDENVNGSVIFTLMNADFLGAFKAYISSDPKLHSIDENGFLRYRNATVVVRSTSSSSAITASYEAGKFWSSDTRDSSISEVSIRSRRIRIFKDHIRQIFDLAYDSVTDMLYWSQRKYRKIGTLEPSGRRFATVHQFDIPDPHGLAIHTTKRILLFALVDLDTRLYSETKIMRSDLDGGNPIAILNYPDVLIVQGITIDFETDRLFYTDISLSSASTAVFSSDLNGRNKRTVFAIPGIGLQGIGVTNGYIYVADHLNSTLGEYFIRMRKREGGPITNLKLNLRPRSIAIYSPDEPDASSIPNECRNSRCEHICVASFNGSSSCKCSDGYTLVDGYRCEAPVLDDNYLLISDIGQKGLLKVPVLLNATDVDAVAHPMEGITDSRIYAIAIDRKNGDLIFYKEDLNDRRIVWGNKSIPFETDVNGIVAHCCENVIYWATAKHIYSWDGTTAKYQTLNYTFEFLISVGIGDITIDCITKHLYWTEYSTLLEEGFVKRSDLSGNNVEIVLENLPISRGLAIDYESHSLHVAAIVNAVLYSVPLPQTEIRNTSIYYHENNITNFPSIFAERPFATIRDIQVVNGEVYLIGDQRIARFRLGENPALVEGYGPSIFNRGTNVEFYNQSYYQRVLEPICKKSTESPSTPVRERDDCKQLLAKALASSDGYVASLHVYLKCVIRSLLPDFLNGEQRNIGIGQLAFPRLQ